MYYVNLNQFNGMICYKPSSTISSNKSQGLDTLGGQPAPNSSSVVDIPDPLTNQTGSGLKMKHINDKMKSIKLHNPTNKLKKFISLKL